MGNLLSMAERTEQNKFIDPKQLLERTLADINSKEVTPTSAIILLITEASPDYKVMTYRSNLPIDREQCILANALLSVQLVKLG